MSKISPAAVANLETPESPAVTLSELKLDRQNLKRLAMGLVVLLVLSGGLGWMLREPLSSLSGDLVQRFGFGGLFVGVMFTDTWIVPPLTHEPLLFFAYVGGLNTWSIFAVASLASVLAGPLGYGLGSVFGKIPSLRKRLRGSAIEPLMKRRGATVVAAAAITPIPFAVSTWLAGAMGVHFGRFLLACLVRILKVAVYFSLIIAGWSFSG